MARTNIYTSNELGERTLDGWFNPAKSEAFADGSAWNGTAHVGLNSGSQWIDETLYRTPGGRWVLNRDATRANNGPDDYRFVDDDAAREWLLKAERDEDVERLFGKLDEEAGPGRPSMGDAPAITVKVPSDLLARVDAAADAAGLARAAWIRRAMEAALS